MKKIVLGCAALLLFAGCSDITGGVSDVPTAVDLDCKTSRCSSLAAQGAREATVIITLSGCEPDQVEFDAVAFGYANGTCGNNGCTARVSGWTDKNSNPVTEIISRSYYVCARFELDGNPLPSAGDEFGERRITIISPAVITVDSWGMDYFSREQTND